MKYLLKNITDFLSNQQFLSNFSISSFATLATIISPILIMPFIILYAGAEVFAKYLLFNTTLLIIFTLSDLGVGYDFKRNIILQKSANARAKLFSNQFFFHFLSICSIIFFYFLLTFFSITIKDYLIDFNIYIVGSFLIAQLLFSQGINYLRYTNKIDKMAFYLIIYPIILFSILVFIFNYSSFNLSKLSLIIYANNFAMLIPGFILLFVMIFKKQIIFSFYNPEDLFDDLRVGIFIKLRQLFDLVGASADKYVIAFFLPLQSVTIYHAAFVVGSILKIVTNSLGTITVQKLSLVIEDDVENPSIYISMIFTLFLLFAVPFLFGTLLLANNILVLISNTEIALQSSRYIFYIVIGTIFAGFYSIFQDIMFVYKDTKAIFLSSASILLLNFLICFVGLILFNDLLLVAVSYMVSQFLGLIFIIRLSKRYVNFKFNIPDFFKIFFCSLIMVTQIYFLKIYLNMESPLLLFINILTAISIYFLSIWLSRFKINL